MKIIYGISLSFCHKVIYTPRKQRTSLFFVFLSSVVSKTRNHMFITHNLGLQIFLKSSYNPLFPELLQVHQLPGILLGMNNIAQHDVFLLFEDPFQSLELKYFYIN